MKKKRWFTCRKPYPFPLPWWFTSTPKDLIAVFWQYYWLYHTSAVYYNTFVRQGNEALFQDIDDTIHKQTSKECRTFRFEAQWVLSVTWQGMRDYQRFRTPRISTLENVTMHGVHIAYTHPRA